MIGKVTSLLTLLTLSVNPKRLLPTMFAFEIGQELAREISDELRKQHLLASSMNVSEVDKEEKKYTMDLATVNAVEKLKAQGEAIPPRMQANYQQILKEWNE